jgi:hypothetical protein
LSAAASVSTVSAFDITLVFSYFCNALLCQLLFKIFFSAASRRFSDSQEHAIRVSQAVRVQLHLCSLTLQLSRHALEGSQQCCDGVVATSRF